MWRPSSWNPEDIYAGAERFDSKPDDYIEAGADSILEAIILELGSICERAKVSDMANPSELEQRVLSFLEELKDAR